MGGLLQMEWIEDKSIIFAKNLNKRMRCYVNVGDRLLANGQLLFVSRGGQDHRV